MSIQLTVLNFRIHFIAITLLLAGLLSACHNEKESNAVETSGPRVITAKPIEVSPDSVLPPKVVLIDESKLKRVQAGIPMSHPTNLNFHSAGEPRVVIAGQPSSVTPGTGSFAPPEVVPANGKIVKAKQPVPSPSLDLRMKDAASCNIQYIDVEQGMNSSYIWDIEEDKWGNLWFATDGGGVSRYDGKSFKHFTETEGLCGNYVRSILEDHKGNLWFATISGISKYDGVNFTNYTTKEGLKHNSVWSLMEDKTGNIWLSTYGGGISKFDGKSFTHFTTEQGLSGNNIWTVREDKSGNLWFGSNGGGVTKYDGNSLTTYSIQQGLCDSVVVSIYEDKNGNLWFGTNNGICKFDESSFTNYNAEQGLAHNIIRNIYEDNSGNFWFGTYGGGIIKFDPDASVGTGDKTFIQYTHKEGLSDDHVVAIHEDNAGNLWLGTYGGGVCRFNPNSFTHYTDREGLTNFYIWSIIEDQNGHLWLGTNGSGVVRYDGRSFSSFSVNEGLIHNTVRAVFEDKSGLLWFGSYGGGLCSFDGKQFTYYTEADGLCSNNILQIIQDESGNLWIATDGGGVSMFDGKSFTNYTTDQGLTSNYVRAIMLDHNGIIWLGAHAGLCSYDARKKSGIVRYNTDEEFSLRTLWSMCEDNSGNIWFGTGGFGVAKYDGMNFTYFAEENGLSNNSVWSIAKDSAGNLWMGTEKGLNCIVTGNENDPRILQFHREDGLKAEDFYLKSALLDRHNRMWWGTGKSLSVLDMSNFRINGSAPEIQLEDIFLQESFVDYRNIGDSISDSTGNKKALSKIKFDSVEAFRNYPAELELPYSTNHLTFRFSAIDWSAPHEIRYQYQLDGLDHDWSQLSSDNKADYRNIPYGHYTFKVRAIGNAGEWSKTMEYSFVIHPPWWHTWWARTLGVMVIIASIVLYVRRRERILRARAIELQRKINEATYEIKQQKHLIEEKHKAITDSINYAERIQRSFLASTELLDQYLREYFVLYIPKDVVSGDFFWASSLINGNFILVNGDSTGHGVPGAIMSLLNVTSLEKAIEYETIPGKILNHTRRIIIDRLKKDGTKDGGWDGMDCSMIAFNFEKRSMQVAAANNPVWIVRSGNIIEIKPDRFPVGKHEMDDQPFTNHELQFEKGDVIYMMTDGFADQFGGPTGKKFKWKQLQKFLLSNVELPMHSQKQELESTFKKWKSDIEQVDDICIIGIRLT